MKQGRASSNSNSGRKMEPAAHAVSMDRTANIGIKQVRTTAPSPMFKGPGLKPGSTGSHRLSSGSQGKHR